MCNAQCRQPRGIDQKIEATIHAAIFILEHCFAAPCCPEGQEALEGQPFFYPYLSKGQSPGLESTGDFMAHRCNISNIKLLTVSQKICNLPLR